MNLQEFIQVTARAEKYYDKEYTNEQKKIMYDILKNWTVQEYSKAITYCIENCKYLPKIADIKQIKVDYKPNYTQEQDNFEYVKCEKCKNTGFIRYYKKLDQYTYEYVALCTCENGKHYKQNGYGILKFIPEIGLDMHK